MTERMKTGRMGVNFEEKRDRESTAPAFAVQNLSAWYGKRRPGSREQYTLRDISFTVPAGRSLGILGPNGSGKTTLLRALTGILPAEGEIQILGTPLSLMKRREIACCCAVMSQFFPTGFSYTVRETVEMGRYARKKTGSISSDREAVDRSLAETGLQDLQNRPITSLSGGQLQRVFFARTLAQETPILLLDEPTSSLDLKYQAELSGLLAKWKQGKTTLPDGRCVQNTLICICHDLSLALDLSDDLLFVKDGVLAAAGRKEAILSEPLLSEIYGMNVPKYMLRTQKIWRELLQEEQMSGKQKRRKAKEQKQYRSCMNLKVAKSR